MKIISYTNKGLRSKNEDFILSEQLSHDISFHIIADGMGGYGHGEKAAMIVVETLLNQVRQFKFSNITKEDIITACQEANLKIQKESLRLSSKLGSTFAAILIQKDTIYAFWMGDSRIYQYNKNHLLLFQSTDHSLINELRLIRTLTTNEIKKYDSIVTRCLTGDPMENPPQIEVLKYSPKDILLLCSDGLHKQINPKMFIDMETDNLVSYLSSKEKEMTDNYSIIMLR